MRFCYGGILRKFFKIEISQGDWWNNLSGIFFLSIKCLKYGMFCISKNVWMIYCVMAGKLTVNSQLPPHTKFLNGFRYPTFQA